MYSVAQDILVTLIDRATRETRIQVLQNRLAENVSQACIAMLKTKKPHTITFDKGKEFAQHKAIAKALHVDIYFAKPYHSWECGSNENTSSLIHQFLSKSMSLDTNIFKPLKIISAIDRGKY